MLRDEQMALGRTVVYVSSNGRALGFLAMADKVKDEAGEVIETPTPSRANLAAVWAASATPPMQVSAMTHSTGRPLGWRRFSDRNWAAERAMVITDGIFSMRGDHAPLDRIMALAHKYDDAFAENVAAAVLFLASEQGGYITGQTLHVNGGMYMG